jgi:DNA-binding SARP family transcriptional activator
MLVEAVVKRADSLDEKALQVMTSEAKARPLRWRPAMRGLLESERAEERHLGAAMLAEIGDTSDIARLRDTGRRTRDSLLQRRGQALARLLAPRVFVEDLGKVRVRIGTRDAEGAEIRRKVLALLCFLLSRPRFASTRDEVIDTLWPESEPAGSLNSLNQTVYFLRRVFEPDYVEATSPGYVGQDGETIWLDEGLVRSRSQLCLTIIRSMPGEPTPDGALALARDYVGRFALDFAYEDWSSAFRDTLHASYLRVVEHAIRADLQSGNISHGILLAERASEVDPEAEEIQVAMIRLHRMAGAHAAAAEHYGRYVRTMRDLGIDPTPLAEI